MPGLVLGFSTEEQTSNTLASVPKTFPSANPAEQAIEVGPSPAGALPSNPPIDPPPSPQKGEASVEQADAAPPPSLQSDILPISPERSNVSSVLALSSVEQNAATGTRKKIDNISDKLDLDLSLGV